MRTSRKVPLHLLFALLSLTACLGAKAATITVNNTNDIGAGSLRDAITKANNGDTINFSIPTTDPNYSAGAWTIALDSGDPNQPFPAYDFGGYTTTLLVISKNITIAGPGASAMVLTNSQGRRNDRFHPGRLFYIAPGANVTISGLTLTRPANADGDSVALEEFGAGAIFNDGGSVSISNCVITGVDTRTDGLDLHGSALFNYGGNAPATLYVSNCAFSNNQTDSGGAYDILNGNNAQDFNLKRFGGSQTLVVSNCSFTGDSGNGTVIINYAGNATIIGSSFSHSNGVSVINSEAVTVTYGAGGSDFYPASMKIVNSTLYDNQGLETIFTSGSFTISDSTVTGNQSTFADTHGRHFPGGIWAFGGTANIANTIVAGNTSVTGAPDVTGNFNSLGNNLIGATDYSTGWIASDLTGSTTAGLLDPQLDPNGLQNNGGPTPTIQLQPTSPALGAGNVALALDPNNNPLLFDQRGAPRVVNGKIDIGAVQSNAVVPPQGLVVTTTSDSNLNNGTVSLREAITYAQFLGGAQTVTFDIPMTDPGYSSVTHSYTITLNGTELLLQSNLTIQGPGANTLTVSGNNVSRVFEIASGATVTLDGLTATIGRPPVGAGILNSGILTVADCSIVGNAASDYGGGIYNYLSSLTLINSFLADNYGGVGGGIYNYKGTVLAINSTFHNNTTDYAGGAIDSNGTVELANSTLYNNSAGYYGGGIGYGGGAVILKDTIIAGNYAGLIGGPDVYGPVTSRGYNLIGNTADSTGFGATGDVLNPAGGANLSSPGFYGGPTPTLIPLSSSPAINAGADLTTLAADGGTTLTVVDGTLIPVGLVIQIDDELILVTGNDGSNNLTVMRGAKGTTQAAHNPGAAVDPAFDQRGAGFHRKIGGAVDIGAAELDIPGPVSDINAATNTIMEGAATGTTVGLTASATDPNGETLAYSLIGDTSGGGFTIDPSSGVVKVANGNKLNYASSPGHSYSVTVQAANGEATGSQTFSIAVTPVAHLGTANGSGTIFTHNNQASFSFNISDNNKKGTPSGTLSYTDLKGGIKLTSTAITSIKLVDNQATFSGKGTIANSAPHGKPVPVSFTVVAVDNGNPGAPKDTFTIQISSPYYATGNLTSGNIVVH